MALQITGPGVGDSIAEVEVLDEQGDSVSLGDIPGEVLVVDVFRGHW